MLRFCAKCLDFALHFAQNLTFRSAKTWLPEFPLLPNDIFKIFYTRVELLYVLSNYVPRSVELSGHYCILEPHMAKVELL